MFVEFYKSRSMPEANLRVLTFACGLFCYALEPFLDSNKVKKNIHVEFQLSE